MIERRISLGDKIELRRVEEGPGRGAHSEPACGKTYTSRIYDILEEDRISILMPMEQTMLGPFAVDEELDMVFYSGGGIFQTYARVVERHKSNQVYTLEVQLIGPLKKHQRREYYRFSCALEMDSRHLESDEARALGERRSYILAPGLPISRNLILDISGGGLRFASRQRYEPESLIYCSYLLGHGESVVSCEVVCKVLGVEESWVHPGTFEHRGAYVDLDPEVREEIIHYIFEEERRLRRKERL